MPVSAPPFSAHRFLVSVIALLPTSSAFFSSFQKSAVEDHASSTGVETASLSSGATDVDDLVAQMTLEEKMRFLHGDTRGSPLFWPLTTPYGGQVQGVPRLHIDDLRENDSPQGWGDATHPWRFGAFWWWPFNRMDPTGTQYPSNLAMGASWDRDAVYRYGKSIGAEYRKKGVNVLLGPGLNLHRIPMGGRNFEYMTGEDPMIGAKLGSAYVSGVQDNEILKDGSGEDERSNIMVTLKHYLFNNQEHDRTGSSSNVPEQAARELYFPPFEAGIKFAGAGAVMCGYNFVDGEKECQSEKNMKKLLNLRDDFFVMSDWTMKPPLPWSSPTDMAAVVDGIEMLKAGVSTEMPWAIRTKDSLLQTAISEKKLSVKDHIDPAVKRVVKAMQRIGIMTPGSVQDDASLAALVTVNDTTKARAREFGRKSMILLKNGTEGDKPVLPLTKQVFGSKTRIIIQLFGCDNLITAPSEASSGNARARHVVQLPEALKARIKSQGKTGTDIPITLLEEESHCGRKSAHSTSSPGKTV